jgi:glycosyl hydrolase family 25
MFTNFVLIFHSNAYAIEPAGKTYEGIDVSGWQGEIDFTKVKNADIKFVYIKSSEGKNTVDRYFRRNYEKAKENGLNIGFYHYVRARNTEDALLEANHFANTIAGTIPDCKLAMDFENFGNLSLNEINTISKVFLERVQEITNKEMIIYSNTSSARNIFSAELANRYPLWVAQYYVSEPSNNGKWNSWEGFQYTDKGTVPGINGYVDRDKFTEKILLENKEEIPNNNTDIDSSENYIRYKIKKGDTLSEIAIKYNTTVAELVRINSIKNPNIIYANEILLIPTKNNSISSGNDDKNNTIYIVQKGDNLYNIAKRFNTTVRNIVNNNNIKNPNLIYPGERIIIVKSTENIQTKYMTYRVKRGDTLYGIARRYNTTVNRLVYINGIRNANYIYINQLIKIPINISIGEYDCGHCIYTVKRGDTLTKIANKFGKRISEIAELNNIKNINYIYVGQKLRI